MCILTRRSIPWGRRRPLAGASGLGLILLLALACSSTNEDDAGGPGEAAGAAAGSSAGGSGGSVGGAGGIATAGSAGAIGGAGAGSSGESGAGGSGGDGSGGSAGGSSAGGAGGSAAGGVGNAAGSGGAEPADAGSEYPLGTASITGQLDGSSFELTRAAAIRMTGQGGDTLHLLFSDTQAPICQLGVPPYDEPGTWSFDIWVVDGVVESGTYSMLPCEAVLGSCLANSLQHFDDACQSTIGELEAESGSVTLTLEGDHAQGSVEFTFPDGAGSLAGTFDIPADCGYPLPTLTNACL